MAAGAPGATARHLSHVPGLRPLRRAPADWRLTLDAFFLLSSVRMSLPADRDEFRLNLARAFDRAWNRFHALSHNDTLTEAIIRTSLAKHLVEKARGGVRQESELAEAGLQHLLSLSAASARCGASSPGDIGCSPQREDATLRSSVFHFRIDDASAKFVREWRVQIKPSR